MLFSEYFGIATDHVDCFDPVLNRDTMLFIDPFLIFKQESDEFKGAHAELIQFFDNAYKLVAAADENSGGDSWNKALQALVFPEPEEFCLGFTSEGTDGSGTGRDHSKEIALALKKAILQGLKNISHFEQVAIFNKGISSDRIGDITSHILMQRFIKYTNRICSAHNIPTRILVVKNAMFNYATGKWEDGKYELPYNEFNKKAILLTPRKYLRRHPTISYEGLKNYLYTLDANEVRERLNVEIPKNVDRLGIVRIALANPSLVDEFISKEEQRRSATPYDFDIDPSGLYRWNKPARIYAATNPLGVNLEAINGPAEFIDKLVDAFESFVEQGIKTGLLLRPKSSQLKSEFTLQGSFWALVMEYCKILNIAVSNITDVDRKPFKFLFPTGETKSVLFQVKKASNGTYWKKFPANFLDICKNEHIKIVHLVVLYTGEQAARKQQELAKTIASVSRENDLSIYTTTIVVGD